MVALGGWVVSYERGRPVHGGRVGSDTGLYGHDVQGYLAHKKTPPLEDDHRPTVGP